jgi:hypothetical protein
MLVCLSFSAWAQRPEPPKQAPRPQQQRPEKAQKIVPVKDSTATIERLRKLLRLNDDQVFKLRPLVDERNRQLAQVQEQGGNAQSRKSDSESIQQKFQSEFRGILTLDQAARFDKEILLHPGSFR